MRFCASSAFAALASAQSPMRTGGTRVLCVDGVVLCVDGVFVDGAMRALARVAARAQSSAEAVVLAIAAIFVSRLPFTFCGWSPALVALLQNCCRRVFHALNSSFTAVLPKPLASPASALLNARCAKVRGVEERFADPTLDCNAIVDTIRDPELQGTPHVPLAGFY